MPLTELLRMCKGKVDATQERASAATDPSSRLDTDCVELVWENGQIMMQGQSNKARKSPVSNNFQTLVPKPQDGRNASGSKMDKFITMDSVMGDFPLSVPSCEMGLDQAVDMGSWLSYPMEDPLHNDYTSDFLHDSPGITMNDLPSDTPLAYREKKRSIHGGDHNNSVSLKHGSTSKDSSVTEKHTGGGSSEVPQFSPSFQHTVPRSGVSEISSNRAGNTHHVASRDTMQNPSSLCAFTSLRLQKLDIGQPSTSSGLTNFPYFLRPAALARADHLTVNHSKRLENDGKRCTLSSGNPADSTVVNLGSGGSQKEIVSNNQPVLEPVNGNSESLPTNPIGERLFANQDICKEDAAKKDVSQNQAYDTSSKMGTGGEEPVVATSSVCSGNSVERASSEPARNLKRKSRETTESEGPSEEVEDESVGAKKAASNRTGSKRSRTAEIHNLSERRRRDRINEKMRALQELIPNCNKVDKASMLDEAIEYLKTLQLQVQMLSMGAGMYMHPMMIPPAMQPIHGAHMPHFSPMALGMGMGMGYGTNMLNVNGGMKMLPFQGPHYPILGTGPTFHGMPGSSLQPFGHPVPGQGLPMSMQRAPVQPIPGIPPLKTPLGLNLSGVVGFTDPRQLAPSSSSKDAGPQVIPCNNVNGSVNQASIEGPNEGIKQSAVSHNQVQVNASETAVAACGTDTVHS